MGDPKAIMANTMDAPVAACDRDPPNSSCHIGNIMLTEDRAPNVNAVAAKQIANSLQRRGERSYLLTRDGRVHTARVGSLLKHLEKVAQAQQTQQQAQQTQQQTQTQVQQR